MFPLSNRHLARELAMKVLYQRDVGRGRSQDLLAYLCAEERADQEVASFAHELVSGVLEHLPEIDRAIAARAHDWRLDRLANVDRNILRLGVYELTQRPEVPPSVVINEAVELAKAYGGPESSRFVNGVLGQIGRDVAPAPVEE